MTDFVKDGLRLHYEVHGTGHPVLLLHGGTVSFEHNYAMFGWTQRLNAAGMQVIGLDFRGHGKSDKPHDVAPYGSVNLARDVIALMDHMSLDRSSLIAYSIGTAVALELLHSSARRFASAVLMATGDGLIGIGPHVFDRTLPALGPVLARAEYPAELPRHQSTYWNFVKRTGGDVEALVAFSKASYPPLSIAQAGAVKVPTLVVSGEKDLVLGQGRRLAQALGKGTYLELAGADHFSLAADAAVQAAAVSFVAANRFA
jgi:pimeloyl-ACP methyl ester carboxylesterase